ncbi:unnamed protein product [Didymodactylos carnosus]|uniref:Uncharacterized protein n=1 Tax=Didymodactylos carnosus TaxID=1234261 RepID=A0A815V9A4_9BILA|nr:unnamed protein product [Didymodactylos carnosus]CAF4384005.1 unnamed protein product [Didymodactylos carnosus]
MPRAQPDREKQLSQQILYMLLNLQIRHYVSEECIKLLANELGDILNAAHDPLVVSHLNVFIDFSLSVIPFQNLQRLSTMVKSFESDHIRIKKAKEYFGYIQPITKSYEVVRSINNKKEKKLVKYAYVPYLQSLEQFIQLREVQQDLKRQGPPIANVMQDVIDGDIAILYP